MYLTIPIQVNSDFTYIKAVEWIVHNPITGRIQMGMLTKLPDNFYGPHDH